MAYGEKLLGISDLLAAWQNRRGRENMGVNSRTQEKSRRDAMYEQAAMQQLGQMGLPVTQDNVAKYQSGMIGPSVATATIKGPGYDSATGMGTKKVLLSDLPGYVSEVDPETMFREKAATDRAMIGAMGQSASAASGQGPRPEPNAMQLNEALANKNYQGGYAQGSPGMAQLLGEQQVQKKMDFEAEQKNLDREAQLKAVEAEAKSRQPIAKPNSIEELNRLQLDGGVTPEEYWEESDRITAEAPAREQMASEAKTEALNRAELDVAKAPGYKLLDRDNRIKLLSNLEKEMMKYADPKTGKIGKISWNEIIKKYTK